MVPLKSYTGKITCFAEIAVFWGYVEINGKKESFDVYEYDQIISEDEECNRYEGIVTQDGCSFFLETKNDAIPLCDLVAERTTILGTTLGEKEEK